MEGQRSGVRVEDRGTIGREAPEKRDSYRHFLEIPTRWMDNDVYGHVNNVIYYSYFDTVVNGYLISSGSLDIERSPIIGLVVETQCRFFKPIVFPDTVHAGLRVARLGNSSVRYEIGLFRNDESSAAAQGHFVYVYVDRETRRPAGLPQQMREELEKIRTIA
ncbi:MAG: acyl-CoA thioesterase [Rubrobacteraceae bacterium]|nr:acyl-CoA thioesterase [Rubrobacteraceae bacterium]